MLEIMQRLQIILRQEQTRGVALLCKKFASMHLESWITLDLSKARFGLIRNRAKQRALLWNHGTDIYV